MAYRFLIFSYFLHLAYSDWVADWMGPIQEQIRQKVASRRMMDEDVMKMVQIKPESFENIANMVQVRAKTERPELPIGLKSKLEETLSYTEDLVNKLQKQIATLEKKEILLKETIINGRLGVTTLTVSTITNGPPRNYIIREGIWSICKGMMQYPIVNTPSSKTNIFNEISEPRCIGQEVATKRDPCVFNSVIKYETIPEHRNLEYNEDDFFCLKPAFNKSLEQYLSVPKKIINSTCQNGVVRSLEENLQLCSSRIYSEYTYYPTNNAAVLKYPLEYCAENDGSCKLIVAWSVSNKTVDSYEFLKKEDNFKKYFIKPAFIEHIL